MNKNRFRNIRSGKNGPGPVVYWMSRDQRVADNWALLFAQEFALVKNLPLTVVFCLVPEFLSAPIRHYGFMLKGLQEVETELAKKNIGFSLLTGAPENEIPRFIKKNKINTLVADFDPLKIKRGWKQAVADKIDVPFYEVDAHNIVPCWIASSKQEFGAYTFRPKINRLLPEFLQEFQLLKRHPFDLSSRSSRINWNKATRTIKVNKTLSEVDWITPGEKATRTALKYFLQTRLTAYDEQRNNPTLNGQSNLSPYLHFGQLSAQRVALEISKVSANKNSKETFLEELIVRRELSDNFCFYNKHYDRFEGFPDWAKKTHEIHRKDRREYLYSREEFEQAKTHDALWNAAQIEMFERGKMHGYLRMYWAKKILEWTSSPEEALDIAIYLNDKYELDGRDPNGYTGIAWSIGGVHDRAWFERPVFGKIRYMNYNGCKSKFNVKEYIAKHKR
jgi:deoxyribodipyrimidine photo-lyase